MVGWVDEWMGGSDDEELFHPAALMQSARQRDRPLLLVIDADVGRVAGGVFAGLVCQFDHDGSVFGPEVHRFDDRAETGSLAFVEAGAFLLGVGEVLFGRARASGQQRYRQSSDDGSGKCLVVREEAFLKVSG